MTKEEMNAQSRRLDEADHRLREAMWAYASEGWLWHEFVEQLRETAVEHNIAFDGVYY